MDPVSAAASLLALLAAAGSTCKFIYNFILNISDAPYKITSQKVKLKCLHQTLSTLIRVYGELPPELQVDTDLLWHIRKFTEDVEKIKVKIQSRGSMRDRSRTYHLRERCG